MRKKIFLSYSFQDIEYAKLICNKLTNNDIEVVDIQQQYSNNSQMQESVLKVISASDYVIVILSESLIKSNWSQYEINKVIEFEFELRGIKVIPVIISDCKMPNKLKKYRYFDLRENFNINFNKMVDYILNDYKINFSLLDGLSFENMILDLLYELKFRRITRVGSKEDIAYDIKAEYIQKGAFDLEIIQNWIIQLKLYNESRVDIRSLHRLINDMSKLNPTYKVAIITSSLLTSKTKEWLSTSNSNLNNYIKVIEGPELKELLLKYPKIINKYFFVKKESGGQ